MCNKFDLTDDPSIHAMLVRHEQHLRMVKIKWGGEYKVGLPVPFTATPSAEGRHAGLPRERAIGAPPPLCPPGYRVPQPSAGRSVGTELVLSGETLALPMIDNGIQSIANQAGRGGSAPRVTPPINRSGKENETQQDPEEVDESISTKPMDMEPIAIGGDDPKEDKLDEDNSSISSSEVGRASVVGGWS